MSDAVNNAAVGDAGQGQPKASIGSFKGVMLCNRPNEFGLQRRPEPTGPIPFKSRVDPKNQNPTGWNPCARVHPRSQKKKSLFQGVLQRHKSFIKNLETHKKLEREEQAMFMDMQDQKVTKFKEQAGKQRQKIKQLKANEEQIRPEDLEFHEEAEDRQPLDMGAEFGEEASQKASQQSKKSKKGQRPAWAKTEKQQEEEKEQEIDDLLEFAYELDYDKYMEDQEIKLAFEIIKDRVNEIKKDQDWKEQLAAEWNEETEKERVAAQEPPRDLERQSVYSYRSTKSKASFMQQVKAAKRSEKDKSEWDRSTVVSDVPRTVEEKLASRIATEMLKDNPKLKGVHSNMSLKKILEKEAKRQLLAETGGEYNAPIISQIPTHERNTRTDPSNLPYLHKCPAV